MNFQSMIMRLILKLLLRNSNNILVIALIVSIFESESLFLLRDGSIPLTIKQCLNVVN